MKTLPLAAAALGLAAFLAATPTDARSKGEGPLAQAIGAHESSHSYSVPAAGTIEVAFSPNEGSEALVVKVIDSARSDLRVLSYSFTSAPVTAALLRAYKRGVAVHVVVDRRNNVSSDKARAALSALATAGADVRTIGAYPIHHDKVIVADRQTVELGSFNYSDAAARKNSENVLVNWGNPKLAEVYLRHFERNYRQADSYHAAY